MKLCITSTGETLESRVDERFGRAPYFLIVDRETKEFHAVKNTAQQAYLPARKIERHGAPRCLPGGKEKE